MVLDLFGNLFNFKIYNSTNQLNTEFKSFSSILVRFAMIWKVLGFALKCSTSMRIAAISWFSCFSSTHYSWQRAFFLTFAIKVIFSEFLFAQLQIPLPLQPPVSKFCTPLMKKRTPQDTPYHNFLNLRKIQHQKQKNSLKLSAQELPFLAIYRHFVIVSNWQLSYPHHTIRALNDIITNCLA